MGGGRGIQTCKKNFAPCHSDVWYGEEIFKEIDEISLINENFTAFIVFGCYIPLIGSQTWINGLHTSRKMPSSSSSFLLSSIRPLPLLRSTGLSKKILLRSMTHVLSGLMGGVLAA